MNKNDWSTLIDAFRILAPALAGYAVWLLKGILTEIRELTERMLELEQWREAHDKLDDTRFTDVRRELDGHHTKGR